jgi:hypothetical protein
MMYLVHVLKWRVSPPEPGDIGRASSQSLARLVSLLVGLAGSVRTQELGHAVGSEKRRRGVWTLLSIR